ncbi:hypothetical protein [Gimesia chilikensis]|uniref:Uncharacterized protein n=1 Tax=Gimesia chilikensis TaxID=2605989 RepID=A0A517PY83_9PLAN|nr:hypothetical protein [Gimesia chilikensis]QDT24345.1 hypothetical protein HG66A1_61770 [Gimesia chilikensis]
MSETKLTKREADKKDRLEAIVDNWIDQALEAGKALMMIKKEKLYRATHKTFESYVKERFSKTRQWAYDFCNWYEVNHLADRLAAPLSNNATTALSSVAKNAPEKVKEIVEESSKIAKKNNHDEPTKDDVKEAKLKVIPVNAPAPAKKTNKIRKVFEASIVVDAANLMSVIGVFDELKVKYEQSSKCELSVMMDSFSSFMLYAGKIFDKAETFEFSIHGTKVEMAEKQIA